MYEGTLAEPSKKRMGFAHKCLSLTRCVCKAKKTRSRVIQKDLCGQPGYRRRGQVLLHIHIAIHATTVPAFAVPVHVVTG